MTVGAGRSYQFTQTLVPIGFLRPEFPSGHLWLLAGEEVPALRADVLSLGGELWLNAAWLVSVTAYGRASDGVIIPDPRPGVAAGRPLFVVVEERGRGIETAARRLKGTTTASIAYTLASTEQRFGNLAFPSQSDRRHVVDATVATRITHGLRAGAAFTFATGAPYTRVADLGMNDEGEGIGALGLPNAGRAAAYASLDLILDWTKSFESWGLGFFVQVRNVSGNRNDAAYEETVPYCASELYDFSGPTLTCGPDGSQPVARDHFLKGIPRVPLLGARVQF